MKKLIKNYLIFALICFGFFTVRAQFTITNPLRTRNASGLKIGDNAVLTAASGTDPNGEGWLRLTAAQGNQKGYMYVMQGFPTSLGVIADFEYLAWRNVADNTYAGADGFSVFLFDASITDQNFKLGGYGGSLGYATYSNPANTPGLSGGYLGIGFDEYGNYSRAAEQRNGGTSGLNPNSIVLRGPTNSVLTNSNVYLTRLDLGDRSGTEAQIRTRDEIDYNTVTLTRPANTTFYRRVQISVTKPGTDYVINIKWRKQNETTFTDLLTYNLSSTTYPIPSNLKLGFAASTGGGFNFHEIRNILLTTPGNLRVDSRSDIAFACNQKKNIINFKIEVTNDTSADLNSISVNSKITDALNNILSTNLFKITGISVTGFTNSNLPSSSPTSNEINGTVGLLANKSGIITVTGEYIKGLKANSSFRMVSNVNSAQILDTDLTNNTAISNIDVRKCNILTNPSMPTRN
ncbi:hypothetical protein FE904_14865 [Chryseobacterium indologenes]|uniref:lectin-like domain-containing protein n=1 Tax=Chryseobacterium indologenes TaxID=253 RepID=UPI000A95DB6A|nr:hypothetical protein [Chryseobacterium indologenes]TLX24933.1 hypothetical protein FE904_14865 [Chryseobacterium indologenes]